MCPFCMILLTLVVIESKLECLPVCFVQSILLFRISRNVFSSGIKHEFRLVLINLCTNMHVYLMVLHVLSGYAKVGDQDEWVLGLAKKKEP